MNTEEKRYKVEERVNKLILDVSSPREAIKNLEGELKESEALWSKYSCDCLGHGITFSRLALRWIKEKYNL